MVDRTRDSGQKTPILRFDLLVGDARVVGDAARRRPAQLLEDFPRTGKREAALAAEGLGDVLNDPPVLPRVARADRPPC